MRIAGVDIPNEKRLEVALTYIFGVGRTTSQKILAEVGLSNKRTKELSVEDIRRRISHESCTARENMSRNGIIQNKINRIPFGTPWTHCSSWIHHIYHQHTQIIYHVKYELHYFFLYNFLSS